MTHVVGGVGACYFPYYDVLVAILPDLTLASGRAVLNENDVFSIVVV